MAMMKEHSCDLQGLFVDPAFRGQRLGRRLIEPVPAQAGARGSARVRWLARGTHVDAMKLHHRIAKPGFVRYRKAP